MIGITALSGFFASCLALFTPGDHSFNHNRWATPGSPHVVTPLRTVHAVAAHNRNVLTPVHGAPACGVGKQGGGAALHLVTVR